MTPTVSVQPVASRKLAAVKRQVRLGTVAGAWGPALDLVWAHLRVNPGLRTDGHNVFFYRHPAPGADLMEVDFGVEVARPFEPAGEVCEIDTPAGEAAVATHRGPYDRLSETHGAIHRWAAASDRRLAGYSMEIYGDWSDDPGKLETTVIYFLE